MPDMQCGRAVAEIVEFCRFLEPTAQEAAMREAATQRVRQSIIEVYPSASVQVFGSFVTGRSQTQGMCSDITAAAAAAVTHGFITLMQHGLSYKVQIYTFLHNLCITAADFQVYPGGQPVCCLQRFPHLHSACCLDTNTQCA